MEFEEARGAIYKRASELAVSAEPEALVQIADAVQKVAYGPQGADTRYRYEADYHQTQHAGETRRSPAGFEIS